MEKREKSGIKETLEKYQRENYYPFHMPGHKQNDLGDWLSYQTDITEIDGFDNLHHPTGLLKEAQERGAKVYGALESFFLVNGSTAGILAAIGAASQQSEEIILARNSHKSAYHGCSLQNMSIHYIFPDVVSLGINNGITARQIEEKMLEFPKAKAVMITSPTYDGVVSNIEEISAVVHKMDGILIVDAAHGAHFGFHSYFPQSPVHLGADIVMMSMHKTMPSPTQTALLHICSNRVDRNVIREQLEIFQTSSPSYLLMAGMDQGIALVEKQGKQLFTNLVEYLEEFYETAKQWKYLSCSNCLMEEKEVYDLDRSKILIFTKNTGAYKGKNLFEQLRTDFHLQLEMLSLNYVTALSSCMDTKEGFQRLTQALSEIDQQLEQKNKGKQIKEKSQDNKSFYPETIAEMKIQEAKRKPQESVAFEDSKGRISGEYLFLYPPGIPILVPGERITAEILFAVQLCKEEKMELEGLNDYTNKMIKVVK